MQVNNLFRVNSLIKIRLFSEFQGTIFEVCNFNGFGIRGDILGGESCAGFRLVLT